MTRDVFSLGGVFTHLVFHFVWWKYLWKKIPLSVLHNHDLAIRFMSRVWDLKTTLTIPEGCQRVKVWLGGRPIFTLPRGPGWFSVPLVRAVLRLKSYGQRIKFDGYMAFDAYRFHELAARQVVIEEFQNPLRLSGIRTMDTTYRHFLHNICRELLSISRF